MTTLRAQLECEPLPICSLPPDHYRVEIPVAHVGKWLTANQRQHFMARARWTKKWRHASFVAVRRAEVPMLWKVYITAELKFPLTRRGLQDKRRRDPANWAPSAKAAIDGLVDAKILVDDSQQYVIGPDMRIGLGQKHPSLVLHLWRLA